MRIYAQKGASLEICEDNDNVAERMKKNEEEGDIIFLSWGALTKINASDSKQLHLVAHTFSHGWRTLHTSKCAKYHLEEGLQKFKAK